MNYTKLNRTPLKIYTTTNGNTYFNYKGRRHNLEDFYRTCTGWTGYDYPDYIHGVEVNSYNPLAVEIIEGYEPTVNVYRATYQK